MPKNFKNELTIVASKARIYIFGSKIWLNSQQIETKHKQKLKVKFFGLFQVLHLIRKKTYKLELLKKQRIHNIFFMSNLEQANTKKVQVDESEMQLDIVNDNSKEYKEKEI